MLAQRFLAASDILRLCSKDSFLPSRDENQILFNQLIPVDTWDIL